MAGREVSGVENSTDKLFIGANYMFIYKFKQLHTMLETEDIEGMRKMMRHSTERRALFDKK